MVRTFLAINLPDRQIHQLSEAVEQWRRYRAAVRWTTASRLHLTLKFLGDVPEDMLPVISSACRQVAGRSRPFELHMGTTGTFPSMKRPRVLWVGLTSPSGRPLHTLQEALETSLEGVGLPRDERPFSPHVTVGRVKSGRNIRQLMETFMAYEPDRSPFTVDSFALYSSTLTPKGPIYRQIDRFVFMPGP